MKQFVGLILAPDAQADLTRKIDRMDLRQFEPWHAFILARLSDASAWRDYDGDGSEFDSEASS